MKSAPGGREVPAVLRSSLLEQPLCCYWPTGPGVKGPRAGCPSPSCCPASPAASGLRTPAAPHIRTQLPEATEPASPHQVLQGATEAQVGEETPGVPQEAGPGGGAGPI